MRHKDYQELKEIRTSSREEIKLLRRNINSLERQNALLEQMIVKQDSGQNDDLDEKKFDDFDAPTFQTTSTIPLDLDEEKHKIF